MKSKFFQEIKALLMRSQRYALYLLHIENKNIQSASGGNFAVFLPKRAGSSVTRVFKRLFAVDQLTVNNLFKTFFRHIYFAAHFDIGYILA